MRTAAPFPVVELLDPVPENSLPCVFLVLDVQSVGRFLLDARKEAFHADVGMGAFRLVFRGRYHVFWGGVAR